ncbi:helix-turn-helix domain-containing protein [Umezawaea beigongshangensis]|uniref:helix-turn-helix domain-containing protein n=1 Tax=Umezawaea beigongshangensis TaxID=2780383 RepID=UPI0018F1EB9F|nr:helix-turn-helix transcriptional regulator [Umezawaea beigongshangensis]
MKQRITTMRSRELGEELRRARERAGVRGYAVCEELEWSATKLSKLEGGWRGTSDVELAALLGRLGTDKRTRDRIIALAQGHDTGYLARPHFSTLADSLVCLIIHERAARTICKYELMLVPGLLQTEEYAETLIRGGGVDAAEDVGPMIRSRMDRQEVLTGDESPDAVFFVHEMALQAPIGNSRIMHDQMMRLAFMSEWSRLSPRVVPLAVNHPLLARSFVLMTFDEVGPVAYVETDVATLFVDDRRAVEFYHRKQAALSELALDAEQSRSVFAHWADVYDRREDRDEQDVAHEQLQRNR